MKLFVINLKWPCVGSVQCHNFSLLAADVQANLLCKGVRGVASSLVCGCGCVIVRLYRQRNPGLPGRRKVSI